MTVEFQDLFSVWRPLSCLKKAESKPGRGYIRGIASVETPDQQGETLIQSGIDWGYLLKKGWFNYEHKAGADNIVGIVEKVKPSRYNGFAATDIEGYLLTSDKNPLGQKLFGLMQSLVDAESDRQLGFSVEGAKLAKNGNIITKSVVMHVAICRDPVHQDARARLERLAKSITSGEIGYQIPADPSGDSLSPLVGQSISGKTTAEKEMMSFRDIVKLFKAAHPEWSEHEVNSLAGAILNRAAK